MPMRNAKLKIVLFSIGLVSSSALAFRRFVAATAPVDDGARVDLLDAGDGPRAPLRYRFRDPPRSFELVTQSGMYLIRGLLQGEASYLPPIASRWTLVESTGSGCARWRLAAAAARDDEQAGAEVVAAARRVLAGLTGREVVTCVDERGGLTLTAPPSKDHAEQQILESFRRAFELQLTIPLPAPAVGKGARWRVERSLPLAADGITYELTYRLNDVTDKGLDVDVAIACSTRPHAVAGASERIVVDQVSGKGHGRIVAMLSELTPVQSNLEFQTTLSLTPSAGEPTEDERSRGYKVVYRARQLMQAEALGPLDWDTPDDQ